jgi:hypothetical protein
MGEITARIVDAFNRRDAEAFVSVADSEIRFQPTRLSGSERQYFGHEGLRQWMGELKASGMDHTTRVRKTIRVDGGSFAVFTEVMLGEEAMSPAAMLVNLNERGLVTEIRAYLSDEKILAEAGHAPGSGDAA